MAYTSRLSRSLTALAGVLALGSAIFSATPTAHAQPTPAAPITWEQCPEQVNDPSASCGRIEVPMHYSDPTGPTITVGFVKYPASNPAAKRGTLFGNPGGPGGDAYSYFENEGLFSWPTGITAEWDRVAVQPRGLPGSTPLDCLHQPENFNPTDPFIRQGGFYKDSCEVSTPGYTASLTTDNTANDWERVRASLGLDKISIMGLSYGTYLGSVYATRYPQHTDRVVLDSGLDPQQLWAGVMGSQQAGYESSLHSFLGWVAARNETYGLGTTPLAVYQAWSARVVAESGTNPTVVPPPAQIGDVPPGLNFAGQAGADAITATGAARVSIEGLLSQALNPGSNQLNSPTLGMTRNLLPITSQWDYLARIINGSEQAPEQPNMFNSEMDAESAEMINAMAMQRMVMCNENTTPPNPLDIPRYAWTTYVTGDIFTLPNAMFTSGAACAGLNPVSGELPISGSQLATRPLQIQATGDPQTPYALHYNMANAMGSHVLTVHGNGHAQVATGNEAVEAVVVEYLRTGHTAVTDVPGLNS